MQMKTICMKSQILFSGENNEKKINIDLSSAEIVQGVVMV